MASPAEARAATGTEAAECARLRAVLTQAIVDDCAPPRVAAPARRPSHLISAEAPLPAAVTDYAPFRRSYQARQQAMQTSLHAQRARLRTALAARSPEMAKLAAVDEVMEQALAEHERRLLYALPGLLQTRFDRLRREAPPAEPDTPSDATHAPRWMDTFRQDMQGLLLAELDFRLQPIEGLLAALRAQPTGLT